MISLLSLFQYLLNIRNLTMYTVLKIQLTIVFSFLTCVSNNYIYISTISLVSYMLLNYPTTQFSNPEPFALRSPAL